MNETRLSLTQVLRVRARIGLKVSWKLHGSWWGGFFCEAFWTRFTRRCSFTGGLHLRMKFLLSNRLFDQYLCRNTADRRCRQVIALTLTSPLMTCAAIVIAKSEKGIFLDLRLTYCRRQFLISLLYSFPATDFHTHVMKLIRVHPSQKSSLAVSRAEM